MLQRLEAEYNGNTGELKDLERLTDEQVVCRVLEGDVASFELIMRRYNQRIFRVVRSILGNDNDAEDVVQEAYVRAFEHLEQFKGHAKFSTWLTRIAIYAAIARRRSGRRMQLLDMADPETSSMPSLTSENDGAAHASNRELGTILVQAVENLPAELRTVFVLRVIEGVDTHETAECLGLSPSNVKVRLHRARSRLQRAIDERVGTEIRQLYQFDGERCDRIVQSVLTQLGHKRRNIS